MDIVVEAVLDTVVCDVERDTLCDEEMDIVAFSAIVWVPIQSTILPPKSTTPVAQE
jgi:hypothetical protein